MGLSSEALDALFESAPGSLCTQLDGLQLPECSLTAIASLKDHQTFDRLVIYTDGSSQSKHRHLSPGHNEDVDVPDAWCFVVLGETYIDDSTSDLTLVGWMSHQVRYEPDHPWYVGANRYQFVDRGARSSVLGLHMENRVQLLCAHCFP